MYWLYACWNPHHKHTLHCCTLSSPTLKESETVFFFSFFFFFYMGLYDYTSLVVGAFLTIVVRSDALLVSPDSESAFSHRPQEGERTLYERAWSTPYFLRISRTFFLRGIIAETKSIALRPWYRSNSRRVEFSRTIRAISMAPARRATK